VLPGFVETEGFKPRSTLRNPLMRRFVIEADAVANAIVDTVEKDKREVTIPWFPYRPVSVAQALVPGVVARLVGRFGYRPWVQD
jgi:short-subunit dehydrogenase